MTTGLPKLQPQDQSRQLGKPPVRQLITLAAQMLNLCCQLLGAHN